MVEHWSPKPGVGRSSRSSRANNCKTMKIFSKIKQYIQESFTELMQKVSWPAWSELQSSAIVVMVASLIIALVVLVMDLVFKFGVNIIYNIFA